MAIALEGPLSKCCLALMRCAVSQNDFTSPNSVFSSVKSGYGVTAFLSHQSFGVLNRY